MDDITDAEFEAAVRRGEEALKRPRAAAAHFDAARHLIVVDFMSGKRLAFDPAEMQGLANASDAALSHIEIHPFGLGIGFPELDADFSVPALAEGIIGSKSWMRRLQHVREIKRRLEQLKAPKTYTLSPARAAQRAA
jgi:hypothetical protein